MIYVYTIFHSGKWLDTSRSQKHCLVTIFRIVLQSEKSMIVLKEAEIRTEARDGKFWI